MKKPIGVTVFGILVIIFAALGILGTLFSFLAFGLMANLPMFQQMPMQYNMAYMLFSLISSLIMGVLGLIAGIGILKLKNWARVLLIVFAIVMIVLGLVSLIYSGMMNIGIGIIFVIMGFIFSIVYYGLILWYFNKKKVKIVFK